MDLLVSTIDQPLLASLHHLLYAPSPATRDTLQEAKSIAATPADIKESPTSYSFIVDMPGLKSEDIRVEVEEEENKLNVLKVSGERKRENKEEKEKGTGGVKYLRMERRVGKFMRNFVLPEDADKEKVAAVCRDGALTVTVEKKERVQPEEKKRRIEVRIE